MGHYKWYQEHECQIKKRWSHVASKWLKKNLYNARRINKWPSDIKETIWAELKEKWSSPEYISKCQKNKTNWAANTGSSILIYRGGSRSTSKQKRKLAIELDH